MNIIDLKDKIEQMSKSRHVELARILIHEYKISFDEIYKQSEIFRDFINHPIMISDLLSLFNFFLPLLKVGFHKNLAYCCLNLYFSYDLLLSLTARRFRAVG